MRWLEIVMAGQLVLAAVAAAGLALDPREVLGISVWWKPLKFEISIFAFLLTLRWMLNQLPAGRAALRTRAAATCASAMAGEIALIVWQSAHGRRSHFNFETPADEAIFSLMGLLILANTAVLARLAWLFWTAADVDGALRDRQGGRWGIRWGLLFVVAGSLQAAAMLSLGAHTVGAADGSAGWPLLNWSYRFGDLRIAHFVGLHGMQALPLAGWLADRFLPGRAAFAVTLAAAGWGALFLFAWLRAGAGLPLW